MRLQILILLFLSISIPAYAQEALLKDLNGDGVVSALAFGDSITRGVGDGFNPGDEVPEDLFNYVGPGYPGRIETLLKIPVDNEGIPGEELTTAGIFRLPSSLGRSSADYILIYEGINDAGRKISDAEVERNLQRAINITRLLGKEPLIGTYFATSEDHESLTDISGAYSNTVKQLAIANDCRVMDFQRAWRTTCTSLSQCDLFNLPDGLHPNKKGYRVMAEVASAALLGINLFTATGPSELAAALGIPATDIITEPDAAVIK